MSLNLGFYVLQIYVFHICLAFMQLPQSSSHTFTAKAFTTEGFDRSHVVNCTFSCQNYTANYSSQLHTPHVYCPPPGFLIVR